jgi:NADH-quinone oxidoreductase subunit L
MDNMTFDFVPYITPTLLILLSPFIGFAINGLLGKRVPNPLSGWIATLAVAISFVCSVMLFVNVPTGSFTIDLFDWITFGNTAISFGFQVDPLTITMLLVITGIGSLIHLYSIRG